tara:strand:- start:298 stop:726 length:429 start_codon:yes stop_codon:yes gene_type:complete
MKDVFKYLLIGITLVYIGYMTTQKYDGLLEGLDTKRSYSSRSKEDDDIDDFAPIEKKSDLILACTERANVNYKDHREHHENIIMQLYDNIRSHIHQGLADHSVSIAKNPMDPESQKKMRHLNTLHEFSIKTLEGGMEHLDKV